MQTQQGKNRPKFPESLYKTAFFIKFGTLAGVAQLVERDLPKVDVEGSSPFSRSKQDRRPRRFLFFDGGSLPLAPAARHPRAGGDLFKQVRTCFSLKSLLRGAFRTQTKSLRSIVCFAKRPLSAKKNKCGFGLRPFIAGTFRCGYCESLVIVNHCGLRE